MATTADAAVEAEVTQHVEAATSSTPDAGAAPSAPPAITSAGAGTDVEQDPVSAAAAELLANTTAEHWSLDGAIGPDDLTIRISTEVTNRQGEILGEAGFNLGVHGGFRGAPKCNLLAFEIAFRAGFVVPLIGRDVGWGFPSSEMLANDALDARIAGNWARVRSRPNAREVNLDRENGAAFFAVARSAIHGRPGHIAVVDWIEEMSVNREGDVRMVAFMGWEANTREGARYGRVVFATTEVVQYARFDRIYLLELRAAEPGNEVALLGDGPRNPTRVYNHEGENGASSVDSQSTQEQ